jgi:hypothetical protein
LHLVYIDEVKCDGIQEHYYWQFALAIPEADVVSVENALNGLAKSYFGSAILSPETEFHGSPIVQGKGPFKGHPLDRRVDLFKKLVSVIESHPNIGRVVIRLDPQKMNRSDHQAIAFMFLVERVDDLMSARKSLALLIADHDKQFVNANVRSLSTFKAEGTDFQFGREIPNVVDTVHQTHSRHSRLLQLTDLYAYAMTMCQKNVETFPKNELTEYVNSLANFRFPSKYKYWPPSDVPT